MDSDKPETIIPEAQPEDDTEEDRQDDSPTPEQVLTQALAANLDGVLILGVSKELMDENRLYFAASKRYDYPPDAFWIISEGMDAVKELVRARSKPKPSIIERPH